MAVATLNPAQQTAVEHERGPALVIAGAGSGKTRVLTARVAKLLERGVPAEAVLAFTFTNRAAKEMRARIETDLGAAAAGVWIGTFHATAMRILRREANTLGLPPGFSIYDRDDQESVLRELIRAAGLPDTVYRLGVVLGRISDAKNALVKPAEAERAAIGDFDRHIASLYGKYQAALRRAGALDFDDLIAETVRLWLDHPEAGARWSRRFQHVLVDEYQDTNHAQFRLVQSLSHVHGNVFVVGDDDQSIYGWRGADLANVLDFEDAFPGAVTIRLEQNYRSTRNILDAANAVIAHNVARKGKTLWSDRDAGAKLVFALTPDETFEARRVRHWLERQQARGRRLADCAVLYRTNAQSRALETELRQSGMPYEIVGGVSFFQRREVKDVLAYLRLAVNPLDTASFFRIWNTPRRGLGPVVEAQVRARLALPGADPVAALRAIAAETALKGAARTGAGQFVTLMDALRGQLASAGRRAVRAAARAQRLPRASGGRGRGGARRAARERRGTGRGGGAVRGGACRRRGREWRAAGVAVRVLAAHRCRSHQRRRPRAVAHRAQRQGPRVRRGGHRRTGRGPDAARLLTRRGRATGGGAAAVLRGADACARRGAAHGRGVSPPLRRRARFGRVAFRLRDPGATARARGQLRHVVRPAGRAQPPAGAARAPRAGAGAAPATSSSTIRATTARISTWSSRASAVGAARTRGARSGCRSGTRRSAPGRCSKRTGTDPT